MENTISFTNEEINVLRGSFQSIQEILIQKGLVGSSEIFSAPTPTTQEIKPKKETKSDKVKKYSDLLSSGKRGTKPNNLKKKKS